MDDKTVRTIFYLSRLREDKNKSEKIKNDSEAGVDFSRARAELAEAAARLQTLRKLRKK